MSWGLCHLPSALMKKWLKGERLLYFCLEFLRRGLVCHSKEVRAAGARSSQEAERVHHLIPKQEAERLHLSPNRKQGNSENTLPPIRLHLLRVP